MLQISIITMRKTNTIDKKSLKIALTNQAVASVLVTHSRFKYLNEIKQMFENFRVFETEFAGRPLKVETGKMAASVLLGKKKVSELEVGTLTPSVVYNEELCSALGIAVPEK